MVISRRSFQSLENEQGKRGRSVTARNGRLIGLSANGVRRWGDAVPSNDQVPALDQDAGDIASVIVM